MADIVLIDDNSKQQRIAYGAAYVDEGIYSDILEHIECVDKDKDFSFVKNAKCVLFHDSLEDFINGCFVADSHEAKNIITDIVENNHIPYVCFSDGHNSTGVYDSDNNLVKLKKSDFYNRLRYFLEYYRSEGKLQFHILAYGRNFQKEIIAKLVRSLFSKFDSKRPSDIITLSDIMPSNDREPHYLEEIVELSQPSIGVTYNDILDIIEDENIAVKDFRTKINNILKSVSQNGKNNYTWE